MSVGIVSHDGFLGALERGTTIALGAYSLSAEGSVARALERAADRGATVSITLEGSPSIGGASGGVAFANRAAATDMRSHGIDVRLAGTHDERLHLKAAVVDGVAFLDDRNWPGDGHDTIVATTNATEVAAVASALAGKPAATQRLATEKASALELEATVVRNSSADRIDLETESFGPCAVTKALRERACSGAAVRLIVSKREYGTETPRERAALARLAASGVDVRLGSTDQKLCVAGNRGWVGSANATYAPEPMLDWGLRVRKPSLIASLESTFAHDWALARPLCPSGLSVTSKDDERRLALV